MYCDEHAPSLLSPLHPPNPVTAYFVHNQVLTKES